MEIRLLLLAFVLQTTITFCIAEKDDVTSPNAPIIIRAKTKVARANDFGGKAAETPKKQPKSIPGLSFDLVNEAVTTTTATTTTASSATETEAATIGTTTSPSVTTSMWLSLADLLDTSAAVPSIETTDLPPDNLMKFLQSLGDVEEPSSPSPSINEEVEHHGRFARGIKRKEQVEEEEEELFEDDFEDTDDDFSNTPLTPSLEDALARLANAPDDHVVSFQSDTLVTPPTPPPTAPAWARIPLYFQGAGSQLVREPSPPVVVNPSLTSVPSNALDLSALLSMMLRTYPSTPAPSLVPNLLFPSVSIVNRSGDIRLPPPEAPRTAINTLYGKSHVPGKMSPDIKRDDKDGTSKELDPAESAPEKVSAKKPDAENNDYEYEYVYYYYDEDDPTNKTMVVKPASAVKPKVDQKLNSVPTRQPPGPTVPEGRSLNNAGIGKENDLLEEQLTAVRTPTPNPLSVPLLTPLFTTPPSVKPLPFVQGPQSPVLFLGIHREPYQGPRPPGRTHPSIEPADLYAFSRALDDPASGLTPLAPFTYKPAFTPDDDGNLQDPFIKNPELSSNGSDDDNVDVVVPSKPKSLVKADADGKSSGARKTTTTEKPTTTTTTTTSTTTARNSRGRRPTPGSGRKTTTTSTTTTQSSASKAPVRLPARKPNQRTKGKSTTTSAPSDDENEEVATEKTTRGGRRGKGSRGRSTTGKPSGNGRRRKTTTSGTTSTTTASSRRSKGRTTAAATTTTAAVEDDSGAASTSAPKRAFRPNLFPRRKGPGGPTTTTVAPEEEENEEEPQEKTSPATTTAKPTTLPPTTKPTQAPTTTASGGGAQSEEEEPEVQEESTPAPEPPKSLINRLRPLRPALRTTTASESDSS